MTRIPSPVAGWAIEASIAAVEFVNEFAGACTADDMPLAVMPEFTVSLAGLADRARDSLRLTAGLAEAEATGKPGRTGDGPRQLAAAAKHAGAAAAAFHDARGRIRKDLAAAGVDENPDAARRPSPNGAYWSLASLDSAIRQTLPSGEGVLDGVLTAAEELALILRFTRRACSPAADAIRAAYRNMPGGTARRNPPAAGLVQDAGNELGQALNRARDAVRALAEDQARDKAIRKQGVPR